MEHRAVLYFPDYIFDISDINEDMVQTSAVNPAESDSDFYIGAACKSELSFSLNNSYGLIPQYYVAGKEFLFQRGKFIEEENVFDIYKKIRKSLFVQHDGFTYAASDSEPYLSVYSSDYVLQNAPQQPTSPVKSLFVVDNKLYCVHDAEPILTAYSISGGNLSLLPETTLNPFQQHKMKEQYAKRGRCYNKQGNTVKEYRFLYEDLKISNVIVDTWEYYNFGYYIALKPEKISDTKISVVAYDRMQKFEIVADSFIDSLTYPISLKNLLDRLCSFIGVTFNSKTLINENHSVPRNFKTENVTAKQVLQWISQLAASFAYFDFNGNLNLSWYTVSDSKINPQNSTAIDIADYACKKIDKVQARAFETEIGVIVPINEQNSNAYIIENNPLLYATTDAQIRPAVTNIYNAIKSFLYVPFNARTYVVNEFLRAGAVVPGKTVTGTEFQAYIMMSVLKGAKGLIAEYSATGNEYRKTKVDAVNQRIVMLNGRTNEIIANVDKFSVTLSEVKNETEKNSAQLLVQNDKIAAEVTRATAAEGELSGRISIESNRIAAEVTRATAAEGELSGRISIEFNKIAAEVTRATAAEGELSGRITVQADQITSEVKRATSAEGQLGSQITTVKQTADGLSIDVSSQGKKITSLELTTSGLRLAVENKTLTFDSNGLTVYGAGFQILNNNGTKVFWVSADGYVEMLGSLTTQSGDYKTTVAGGIINFYYKNASAGSIKGKRGSSGADGIKIEADFLSANTFISDMISADKSLTCRGSSFYTSLIELVTGVTKIGDQISVQKKYFNLWTY